MNSNNGTVRGDALATVSPGMLPPPFTVRWSTKSNGWVVWMPETDDLLMIDGAFISITGISAAPELPSGWYTIDDLIPGSDSIYLVITITDSTGSATADLSGTQGTSSSGETVYNVKIASMTSDPNTDEKSIEQYTNSSVIMGSGGSGGGSVVPDNISTEFIPEPEEGEEPTGDEGKLQIFDFNSDKSDSPEGLVERLHADTETGDIKIRSGTNIMLLARRGGKMVYIPLTAGGTDPEDEKPYDPENPDPCAHPGDNAPGAETHSEIGGSGGIPFDIGGVPAGRDIHTGDDDCNCERI